MAKKRLVIQLFTNILDTVLLNYCLPYLTVRGRRVTASSAGASGGPNAHPRINR